MQEKVGPVKSLLLWEKGDRDSVGRSLRDLGFDYCSCNAFSLSQPRQAAADSSLPLVYTNKAPTNRELVCGNFL